MKKTLIVIDMQNLFKTQPIPSFVPMGVRGYDESLS